MKSCLKGHSWALNSGAPAQLETYAQPLEGFVSRCEGGRIRVPSVGMRVEWSPARGEQTKIAWRFTLYERFGDTGCCRREAEGGAWSVRGSDDVCGADQLESRAEPAEGGSRTAARERKAAAGSDRGESHGGRIC